MDAQELRNLQEAYMEVVENQQLGEGHRELNKKRMRRMDDQIIKHMDRDDWEKAGNIQNQMDSRTPEWSKMQAEKNKNRPEKEKRSKTVSEADLYDIVMDYLLDEGYADTQQAAEAIMVNMSEEWREDIVEEVLDEGNRFEREYNVPNWDKVYNRNERDTPRHTRNPERRPSGKLETSNQTTKRVGKQRRQDHVDTRGVKQIPGAKGIRMRFGRAF